MLTEIVKFNTIVVRKLEAGKLDGVTLGQFLRSYKFSLRFKERYLFPMVAAIWSAPEVEVDRFPMLSFARFFNNHGLLTISRHPQWYFVAGGSQTYVRAFLKQFPGVVHTNADIAAVQRKREGVVIKELNGKMTRFDRVVIATHADEALELLEDPSHDEQRLLGAWRYSINRTYLHTDTRWMPPNQRAWSSWNFIRVARSGTGDPITLTYDMNRLQRLDTRNRYLVTLNPSEPIDEASIIARMTYTHPIFTFDSMATQADLPRLNGRNNTSFCGSYYGYGFHEDAARSGVEAAAALGANHEL
jgi:predicted NAD/FAD-binding protein